MLRKSASLLWILPALAACQAEPQEGQAQGGSPLTAPEVPEVMAVTYRCESGTDVAVTLDNGRALHLTYEGQAQTLQPQDVSSGATYRNAQYRWVINRGEGRETAQLFRGDTVLETCSREQASAAPAPGLAPCRAEQLELRAGETDAGMGHRQQTFEVALRGEQPCLLPAWPSVKLEGEGAKEPPAITRTTDSYFGTQDIQERLTVTKERPVMFHMGWSVIPDETKGDDPCPNVTSMTVNAPGGGTLTPVAQAFSACGRGVVLSPFRLSTMDARKTD